MEVPLQDRSIVGVGKFGLGVGIGVGVGLVVGVGVGVSLTYNVYFDYYVSLAIFY